MATPLIPSPRLLGDEHRARRPRRVRVVGDLFHGGVPAGAVYAGRSAPGLVGSVFANRHTLGWCRVCGVEHDRAGALAAYGHDLAAQPELVALAAAELSGVDVACWCRLDQPCHVDVLLFTVFGPRVWLAGGGRFGDEPADQPPVRDQLMRQWRAGDDGEYYTAEGRHHAPWAELRAWFDLVEVAR